MEFHELPDNAVGAEHFHDAQHEVRRRDALRQRAGQLEADHVRDEHGNGLAEHGRFRLDAADAPAENTQTIDHGGVTVGTDESIGEGNRAAVLGLGPHCSSEVLEVYLVADAGARRDQPEVVERTLPPAQEPVAFPVALHLDGDVLLERCGVAEPVDHHRVVDDQVDGRQRVDDGGVLARADDGTAHGGEVGDARNAGEVLHQHTCGAIRDFPGGRRIVGPVRQRFDVGAA